MIPKTEHVPVLLAELLALLQPKPGEHFVDATLGGGGMAKAILDRTAPNGNLVGIEQDMKAIVRTKAYLRGYSERCIVTEGNFKDIEKLTAPHLSSIQGIYFDLGISTDQLEDETKGISFQNPQAPLDMRMVTDDQHFTASHLVMSANKDDLASVFKNYGGEVRAKKIAEEIVKVRKHQQISTVEDLLKIIKTVYPYNYYKRHPATKVWQALRIAVNDELDVLEQALPKAFSLISKGGRIAVISFHSLEDRIVKKYFKTIIKEGKATSLTKKVIVPTEIEIKINPRSRSAKLRGVQKEA